MRHYDTITALPPIPDLGEAPIFSPSDLMQQLDAAPELLELAKAVFERMALQSESPIVETRWFDYFAALTELSNRTKTPFLSQLAEFESALMRGLETVRLARAPALRKKVERAEAPSASHAETARIVEQWTQTEDPLKAHFGLLEGRRDWVVRNGDWFSFTATEIVSYSAALMISVEAAVLQHKLPPSMMLPPAKDRWNWSEWA